jgi:hypothetical protein
MAVPSTHEVTQLLKAWTTGDEQALEKLTRMVYRQLHRVAQRCMAGNDPVTPCKRLQLSMRFTYG